mgnify:CR=1 FL=1
MEILIFLIVLLAPSLIFALKNKDELPEDLIVEKFADEWKVNIKK